MAGISDQLNSKPSATSEESEKKKTVSWALVVTSAFGEGHVPLAQTILPSNEQYVPISAERVDGPSYLQRKRACEAKKKDWLSLTS